MVMIKKGDIVKHVHEASPKLEVLGIAFDHWVLVAWTGKTKWMPPPPYAMLEGLTGRFDLAVLLDDVKLVKAK